MSLTVHLPRNLALIEQAAPVLNRHLPVRLSHRDTGSIHLEDPRKAITLAGLHESPLDIAAVYKRHAVDNSVPATIDSATDIESAAGIAVQLRRAAGCNLLLSLNRIEVLVDASDTAATVMEKWLIGLEIRSVDGDAVIYGNGGDVGNLICSALAVQKRYGSKVGISISPTGQGQEEWMTIPEGATVTSIFDQIRHAAKGQKSIVDWLELPDTFGQTPSICLEPNGIDLEREELTRRLHRIAAEHWLPIQLLFDGGKELTITHGETAAETVNRYHDLIPRDTVRIHVHQETEFAEVIRLATALAGDLGHDVNLQYNMVPLLIRATTDLDSARRDYLKELAIDVDGPVDDLRLTMHPNAQSLNTQLANGVTVARLTGRTVKVEWTHRLGHGTSTVEITPLMGLADAEVAYYLADVDEIGGDVYVG